MRLISRRLKVTGLAGAAGERIGAAAPQDWLGSVSPETNVMRRLLVWVKGNDRAVRTYPQAFCWGGSSRRNRRQTRISITHSLERTTIRPNFGQVLVTLGGDIASVASKARSDTRPDSSAPQPPGLGRPGQLSSAYGSIPKQTSGRFDRPDFFISNTVMAGLGPCMTEQVDQTAESPRWHCRRAEHDPGLWGAAALHQHSERIDVLVR